MCLQVSVVVVMTLASTCDQERLKEALDNNFRRVSGHEIELPSCMEYLFGICRSDGRLGKQGSRCVDAVKDMLASGSCAHPRH